MADKIIAYRSSVYIEPISACNMKCRMCYANTAGRNMIPAESLVSFVERFAEHAKKNSAYTGAAQERYFFIRIFLM